MGTAPSTVRSQATSRQGSGITVPHASHGGELFDGLRSDRFTLAVDPTVHRVNSKHCLHKDVCPLR